MILLDTDSITVLQIVGTDRRTRLLARIAVATESVCVTIFNAEEQMRGWLGVRIPTRGLKIASIARVNDALLATSDRRDFEQVPGLRVADWLR